MSRSRQRVTLEAGLKLDLNRLVRRGFIRGGVCIQGAISWTENFSGEQIASGIITADMAGEFGGWLRVDLGELKQTITLTRQPRHFGGGQWYFTCPSTGRSASVLWKPPGAQSFACRQRWGRQVAYQSQFLDAIGRAHLGKDRIHRRLCSIGSVDPNEWDFPPKPKWMRWPTYRCAEEKFDRYEAALDWGCLETVARILGPDWFDKAKEGTFAYKVKLDTTKKLSFIDGHHQFRPTLFYFEMILRRAADGCLFARVASVN